MKYNISHPGKEVRGEVALEGSKSISNRVLLIRALSGLDFPLHHLSPSDDSRTMQQLLRSGEPELDVGAAGTTMRFLTAYFAIQEGREVVLTGSERMKKRPIGILVNALRELGADIGYAGEEGYPPLRIRGKKLRGGPCSIRADVSSQYLSALLMIGASLQNGIVLKLQGVVSSRPYLEMTLRIMDYFGVSHRWENDAIFVDPQAYQAREFTVEGDWSAASYYYSITSQAKEAELLIRGLDENSLQGDRILASIYEPLGVRTQFTPEGLWLTKSPCKCEQFTYDFSTCPDLAQTLVVNCAALGLSASINGVESLAIKETDRTAALRNELAKFGLDFNDAGNGYWHLRGKLQPPEQPVSVRTYEDHRMAMSFAPLALSLDSLLIEDPMVVTKSYSAFWSDLETLGFVVEPLS